jgi:hypothetical protein
LSRSISLMFCSGTLTLCGGTGIDPRPGTVNVKPETVKLLAGKMKFGSSSIRDRRILASSCGQ